MAASPTATVMPAPPRDRPGALIAGASLTLALGAWLWAQRGVWDTAVGINHASGIIAALADGLSRGETPGREVQSLSLCSLYAPPFPALVAVVHESGASWLHALRIASVLTASALVAAVVMTTRTLGGGRAACAVAVAALLTAFPVKLATLAGRADLLAAAFTVAAFAAWQRDPAQRGWGAPALAALAMLTKLTEVTIPLAVVLAAVVSRDAGGLSRFAGRFALCALTGFLLLLPLHAPEWYREILGYMFLAPPNASHPLRGASELLRYGAAFSEIALIAAGTLVALRTRDETARRSAIVLGSALVIAVGVMSNRGADHNHLVTTLALAAAVTGLAWDRVPRSAQVLALLVFTGALWRDGQSFARQMHQPIEIRAHIVQAIRSEPGPVLTEDPLLALMAGRTPVIADAGAIRSRERRGDPRARALVEQVQRRAFALIVLRIETEERGLEWYRDFQFGTAFATAVQQQYRKTEWVDGYWLYRPLEALP